MHITVQKLTAAVVTCLLLVTNGSAFGQDEKEKPELVKTMFKGIRVVNANTVETVQKNTLEFRIVHRFGNIGVSSNGGGHTLWGFDQASNIRFSLDWGVTDKLMIGLGRSKTNEHIDGSVKYRFLEQTKDFSMPVSVAWYSNMAFTPQKDPDTLWTKTAHRFSYTHQLIVGSQITPWLSLEVLPTMVHRNFVRYLVNTDNGNAEDENTMFALGAAGRLRITKSSAIVFDYFHAFSDYRTNNATNPFYAPWSVGYEIDTGGHLFHLNLTNAVGIIENDFLINSPDDWGKGGYKFGFTIARVFNL